MTTAQLDELEAFIKRHSPPGDNELLRMIALERDPLPDSPDLLKDLAAIGVPGAAEKLAQYRADMDEGQPPGHDVLEPPREHQ